MNLDDLRDVFSRHAVLKRPEIVDPPTFVAGAAAFAGGLSVLVGADAWQIQTVGGLFMCMGLSMCGRSVDPS